MALKTQAYLSRTSGGLIEAQMENISVGGLYCRCSARFDEGEKLECLVSLTSGFHAGGDSYLRGSARVVRVEPTGDSELAFGVACEIQSYDILPPNAFRSAFSSQGPS